MLKPMTPARLRQWRILRGYTVPEMHRLLRVSRATYYRMENERIPNPYMLALAFAALERFIPEKPLEIV